MQNATWLAGLAALLTASVARADWHYTRWGMTPEQVVAASGGKAELLPPKRRPRISPLETAASGEFQDGAMQLRTAFSFSTDGGGLACVSYGLMNRDGDETFKTSLTSRYGQPQRVSGLPAIRHVRGRRPHRGQAIAARRETGRVASMTETELAQAAERPRRALEHVAPQAPSS